MTTEQNEMLANTPVRETAVKSVVTTKRVVITLGILTGVVAAYCIGSRIVRKVQARSILKSIPV